MRYKFKPKPKGGEKRIITKFLYLPKCIDDELRWLEKATFEQVFVYTSYVVDEPFWSDTRWVNE